MSRRAPPAADDDDGDYEDYRDRQGRISRDRSTAGRDIAPLPPVADPLRKELCGTELARFCDTYLPKWFYLAWSPAHRRAVDKLQRCVLDGGLFALAFPRGDGKTTMSKAAALWAMLYGYRRFLMVVAANKKPLAESILENLKDTLETNDLLYADFPEACHPIRRLDRIPQRANGQTLGGVPTRLTWSADEIALAIIPGSACAGAAVRVVGIDGAIRGANRTGPDGEAVRPDMVILDDPQDRSSAKSPVQTADRLAIVHGDVLGLAGPDKTIAAVMPCTVIYPNDLADQMLDREKNPEWQGEKTRLLVNWPADMDLWDEYSRVRSLAVGEGRGAAAGDEFYAAHREAMDAGAAVYWPERVRPGDLSALQSAMNLYYRNPRAFRAECQNEPEKADAAAGAKELAPDAVAQRLSGTERLLVPADGTRLSCMFDLGKHLHWYAVVAWTERFGGTVVDYGSWPRQNRGQFAANDPRPSIRDVVTGGDQMNEAQLVYAGLERLAAEVLGRTYYRAGGGELRVEICLVDSGDFTKAVYQFVQRYRAHYGCPIYPSKGIGRTLTARGVSEWKARPGERKGYHWRLTSGEERKTQAVQFDTDAWKSFLHLALTTPPGGPTGLSFFGTSAAQHAMIGDHCAAEYSEPKEVRGAWFDKWLDRPHKPDNHLWDTLIGCAVGASVLGVEFSATADGRAEPTAPAPKPLSYADVRAGRQAGTPQAAGPDAPRPLTYAEAMRQRGQK